MHHDIIFRISIFYQNAVILGITFASYHVIVKVFVYGTICAFRILILWTYVWMWMKINLIFVHSDAVVHHRLLTLNF
jgi:hypothetical protein